MREQESYIPIISRDVSKKLKISDIYYIERIGRKLVFVTENEKYGMYEKVERIEKYLGENFFHCLVGLIVNLDKIEKLENFKITFDNKQEISLARDSYVKLKQIFNSYILKFREL